MLNTENAKTQSESFQEGLQDEEFNFRPRFSVRKRVMGYYYLLTVVVFWASYSLYNNHWQETTRLKKFATFHKQLFVLYGELSSDAQSFPAALQALSYEIENNDASLSLYNTIKNKTDKNMADVKKLMSSDDAQLVWIDRVRKWTGPDPSLRRGEIPDVKKRLEFFKLTEKKYNAILALRDEADSAAQKENEINNARDAILNKPISPAALNQKKQDLQTAEEDVSAQRKNLYDESRESIADYQKSLKKLEAYENDIIAFEQKGAGWHGNWIIGIAAIMFFAAPFIVIVAGAYTDRVFIAPVLSLAQSAKEIAGGNLDHEANVKTGDEYEVLAEAFNIMKNKLKKTISYQQVQINKLLHVISSAADGNLTRTSDIRTHDDFGKLSSSLNTMIENLRTIVESVENAIQQLIRASQEILSSSQTQSNEVSDQSVQITEIASSFQELSATARQISDSAKKVSETSTKAAESAQSGEMAAAKSIDAMKNIHKTFDTTAKKITSLQERSKNIGKVVTTIADLAERINLLALNAAIEAARAGEHGKGFAVVADEVRKLAEQSTQFTEDIKAIITGIQEETQSTVMAMEQGTKTMNEGVKLVTLAGEALKEIAELVEDVANHSKEILFSTQQQQQGSEQVSTAVSSVSQTMRDIEYQARHMSSAAQGLVDLSKLLEENVKNIVTKT